MFSIICIASSQYITLCWPDLLKMFYVWDEMQISSSNRVSWPNVFADWKMKQILFYH